MADAVEPIPTSLLDALPEDTIPRRAVTPNASTPQDLPEPIAISQRCEWCGRRFAVPDVQNGRCPHCNTLIPGSAAARQAQAEAGIAPELADQGFWEASVVRKHAIPDVTSVADLEPTLPPFYFSDPDHATVEGAPVHIPISVITPAAAASVPAARQITALPADPWSINPGQLRQSAAYPLRYPDWRAQVSMLMGFLICIAAVALSFLVQGFGLDQLVINLRILAVIVTLLTVLTPFIAKTRKDSTLRLEPDGLWLQRPMKRERYISWEFLTGTREIAASPTVTPRHSLRPNWQALFGLTASDAREAGIELCFSSSRPRRLCVLDSDSADHGRILREMVATYSPASNLSSSSAE